ncbi:hypothetical protein PSAC2689_100308 [Paraburkholderia sacchari]
MGAGTLHEQASVFYDVSLADAQQVVFVHLCSIAGAPDQWPLRSRGGSRIARDFTRACRRLAESAT